MCNIWQQKKDYEITPEETYKILSQSLFAEVTGLGINGGEPTLRKDIDALTISIIKGLPKLSSISLITNSYDHKTVIKAIGKIADICLDNGIHLDVMQSLDGIGASHDKVRGKEGNFDSFLKVHDYIKSSKVGSHRTGTTIIKDNVLEVEKILDWAIQNDTYARFRVGVSHGRLYNRPNSGFSDFEETEKFHLVNFLDYVRFHYETDAQRRFFYLSLRNQIIYGEKRIAGCDWKHQGVTLTSRGELLYCAVESKTLGKLTHENGEDLYWGNNDHLNDIQENKCADCRHDYVGYSSKSLVLKDTLRKVSQKLPSKFIIPIKDKLLNLDLDDKKERSKGLKGANHLEAKPGNRLLIVGWYGTETLGDKAILAGITYSLTPLVDKGLVIDLLAIEPYVCNQTTRTMPELEIGKIVNWNEAESLIKKGEYKIIGFGGGPIMTPVKELNRLSYLFELSKLIGVRTIIIGSGIGPIYSENKYRYNSFRRIINSSDKILLRDTQSHSQLAKHSGLNFSEAKVILDPSVIYVREVAKKVKKKDKLILIALREWPIHEYGKHLSALEAQVTKNNAEQNLVSLVRRIREEFPVHTVVPFCMHKYAVGGDDRFYYRELFREDHNIIAEIEDKHLAPSEDVSMFAKAEFVIAMRFHSVVLSATSNTPFIALDYSMGGKIKGFCEHIDQEDRLISMSNINPDLIIKRMKAEMGNTIQFLEDSVIEDTRASILNSVNNLINEDSSC